MNSIKKKISTKCSPYVFQDIDNIDPTEEGLLDFCPICQEPLAYKKVRTLKIHERDNHPRTDKAIMRQFFTNTAVLTLSIIMVIMISTVILVSESALILADDVDGYTLDNQCTDMLTELRIDLYEKKQFDQSHLDTLTLLEDGCDLRMRIGFPADGEFRIVPEFESVFDNTEAYEHNIEWMEGEDSVEYRNYRGSAEQTEFKESIADMRQERDITP